MSRSACMCMGNALGSWIGNQAFIHRKHQLFRFGIHGCSAFPLYFSSISIDSSQIPLLKTRKKSKTLSTNVIHVGEEAVIDKYAKVKRLNAFQLYKVDKSTQSLESSNLNSSFKPNQGDDQGSNFYKNLYKYSAEETFFPLAENINSETEVKNERKSRKKLSKEEKSSLSLDAAEKKKEKRSRNEKSLKLYNEMRWKGRNQNFNDTLSAFICVCMATGQESSAFQTFNHYLRNQQNTTSRNRKVLTINSFNEILKAIAVQGDYNKMKEICQHLKKSHLTPNLNTFAHILTCLGQLKKSTRIVREIESTLQWMEQHDVNLEELFSSGFYPGDSLRFCIQAVEAVKPDIKEKLAIFNSTSEIIGESNSFKNPLVNSLNDSFFSNKVSSPAEGVLTPSEMRKLIQNQIDNELKGHIAIPSIMVNEHSPKTDGNQLILEEWEAHWRQSLHSLLVTRKKFMHESFVKRDFKGLDFYPYFNVLDEEEILNLLIMEVHKLCLGSDLFSPTLNSLAGSLGDEFYNRFLIKYKRKTNLLTSLREVYDKYCHWYLDRSDPDSSYIPRVQWNKFVLEGIEHNNLRDNPPEWPYSVKCSIGKMLWNIILSAVVIWEPGKDKSQAVPAFYRVHRTYEFKVRDEVKPSPLLIQVYRGAPQRMLTFPSGTLPMVAPSVPWVSITGGGYFVSRADFIRVVQHAQQQKRRMLEGGTQSLFPIMDSLNQLGSIPWKINHDVLDLIINVFRNKGWEKMDISPPSSELAPPPPILSSMSGKEKQQLRRAHLQYKEKKNGMHSLWCSMLYKLSIANYFRDQTIWLPLNMDFRGRTYPIPPHLTHLSSDVFRSIMLFAQGKKLGSGGLFWLKLHLINLTGLKKRCSIQDRIDFCEEVMDEIYDSADRPLDGRQWWAGSDEPWQTLAACKELVAAIRSGCPEEFVSRLPIHQDGSCNGLQHYAALGRDKTGAESVNLSPSLVPQDVYSNVVALVEESRKKDAEEGLPIAQVLEGVVKRKVIKQTIMTTVYGVTRFGAKLQILKQLNYLDDFPEEHRFAASFYLTNKTFESLGTIFSATKQIQDWFVKIAEGVSKQCFENVEWVTPLGFPVVQPYSKYINSKIVPGKVFNTFNNDNFLTPNANKQKNAFPPNFIHSLDSSHMMLTSIFCQHAGITFISIHDCFWTHAATVPIMNKICRDQFVALHSQPILEDMAKFMQDKYSEHEKYSTKFASLGKETKMFLSLETLLDRIPKKGEFNINEVKDSVFFFS